MYIIRFIFNISFFCILASCTAPLKKAGEDHRAVTEKWYELSRYAESKLPEYGIKLTSQLSLVHDQSKPHYILRNIKLSKNENHFNIDLLEPHFEQKFICNPVCIQLLEYERTNAEEGKTLLNQYFDHHEFELFKFYGNIYLLNKQLEQLNELEPAYVQEYLDYLSSNHETFDSLESFQKYITNALTVSGYGYYLENKNPLLQNLKLNKWWSERGVINSNGEIEKWNTNYGKNGQVNENVLWVLFKNKETESWQPPKIASAKKPSKQKNIIANWKNSLKTIIEPGNTVCSFKSNLIGTVVSRQDNHVIVELFGQAKNIVNGIIMDVENGFLFGEIQEVSFLPLQQTRTFSVNEVAVCKII